MRGEESKPFFFEKKSQKTFALLPVAALIGAMLSIQYGATLAKGLFPAVGAQGTTALRLAVAALILCAVMRPWRARLSPGVLPSLLGYGAALGAMNLCFYLSLRTVPLGIAVAIEFLGPLVVATISSRRRIDLVWIGLALAGILLLSPSIHGVGGLDPVGVGFAGAAGVFWGFYIVFGQRAGAALGGYAAALGTIIAAMVVVPIGVWHAGGALLAPPVLLSALAVGLFSSALPYSLEMVALTRLPATVYGTLTSLEPALGALAGLIILRERLGTLQWVGIGVVVVAALGRGRFDAGGWGRARVEVLIPPAKRLAHMKNWGECAIPPRPPVIYKAQFRRGVWGGRHCSRAPRPGCGFAGPGRVHHHYAWLDGLWPPHCLCCLRGPRA